MGEHNKESKDIIFPILLIFVGFIFLLNTTGILGWGVWEYILRFWPIFLILAGIRLILNKSITTEIVLAILTVFLFVIVGIFSYTSYTSKKLPLVPTSLNDYILKNSNLFLSTPGERVENNTVVSDDAYDSIEERVVNLKIGASEFNFSDNSDSNDFLYLNSKYAKNYIEPSLISESKDNILTISFDTVSPRRIFFFGNLKTEFDFNLGKPDLETALNVTLGAGKGDINLDSTLLNKLSAEIGAGKLTVSLQNNAVPSTLNIQLGAGEMILNLPEDVGYRLTYDLGVGEITQNNEEVATFLGKNSTYESTNYTTTEQKIEITATIGVGSLEINNI